jgi:hypothetical protein
MGTITDNEWVIINNWDTFSIFYLSNKIKKNQLNVIELHKTV